MLHIYNLRLLISLELTVLSYLTWILVVIHINISGVNYSKCMMEQHTINISVSNRPSTHLFIDHRWCVCHMYTWSPGEALPLWQSVGMRCSFAPHFGIWAIFLPNPKIGPCLPFLPFQIYHFIQILLGPILNFERHTPTDFYLECAPNPPTTTPPHYRHPHPPPPTTTTHPPFFNIP